MIFFFFQALQSTFSCRGNIQQKFRSFFKKVLFLKPFLKQNISAEKEKTFLRSEGVIMEGHAQEEMKEDFIAAFKLNSNSTQLKPGAVQISRWQSSGEPFWSWPLLWAGLDLKTSVARSLAVSTWTRVLGNFPQNLKACFQEFIVLSI